MQHVKRAENVTPFWKTYEPFLDENRANTQGKPTLANRGLFSGYSLPVWNSDQEELYFRMRVPFRWDGTTKPWFVAITAPVGANDIGEKYKFQLEWVSGDVGEVLPDTIAETLTDEITLVDGSAYYANIIAFELTIATIVSGQKMQARLRRIASAATAIDGEVSVYHWATRWKMNKLGTTSVQGY